MIETIKIGVEGMHCVNCQAAVEKALKTQKGVSAASVVLSAKVASVTYDPGLVTPSQLASAVKSAGYEPKLPEGQKKN